MRKFRKVSLMILLLFLVGNFTVPFSPAGAAGDVDQACDVQDIQDPNDVGYWKIKTHDETSQTFRPTVDKLTAVIIAVGGESGARISLSIIDTSNGQTVASRMEVAQYQQAHWLEYKFDPIVTLDTSKQYKIRATTAYNDIYWYVATIPCYANGYAIIDGNPNSGQDFGFATYGYDSTPPSSPPASPPEDDPTPPSSQDQSSSDPDVAETDESVAEPKLTSVKKNQEIINIDSEDVLDLEENDEITLNGTTAKGTEVVVLIGLNTYKATVDGEKWSVTISADGLKDNEELLVQGQAQKDEKGSEKTDFFKTRVVVTEQSTTEEETQENQEKNEWSIYYTVGIALFVIASAIGGYVYYVKRKKKLSKPNADIKKKEPPKLEK